MNRKTRRSRELVLAALGAFAVAACDADREDFIQPIGDVILNMAIEPAGPVLPSGSGSIDAFTLVSFDPGVSDDVFGRATGALGLYNDRFGVFGWDVFGSFRNSSQDPRLPALEPSSAVPVSFLGLFNPLFTAEGPGVWDLFGGVTGLKPNTVYTVVLARMSLTVNGAVDAEQVLLGDPVDDPDELSFLGGAEGGDPTVICDFSENVGVDASLNPVALGTILTNASGSATIDCRPEAINDSPWWRSDASQNPPGAADSTAVGVNATTADGGGVNPGQYNYVLLIEGIGTVLDPVPDVNPTVRMQIGPDIDASGNVIADGFAPFPAGPASDAELLAGEGGIGRASTLSFSATDLPPLDGTYQVWLVNEETGDMISPSGEVTITNVDEMGMDVIVSESVGSTFNPTDPSDVVAFSTSDALAGTEIGQFTHIFVSIEASEAGAPSPAQPLWAQFTEMNEAPADPSMWEFFEEFDLPFGTFDASDPSQSVVFAPSGFGQGAFTGDNFGTTDYFRARFRNIARPPGGFFYEGFMRQVAGGVLTSETSTGDLTTEFAEGFASLRDVDIDPSISSQVGPEVIIESANRATLEEVGGTPFESFEEYVLKLRAKLATSPTEGFVVAVGEIPGTLKDREAEQE